MALSFGPKVLLLVMYQLQWTSLSHGFFSKLGGRNLFWQIKTYFSHRRDTAIVQKQWFHYGPPHSSHIYVALARVFSTAEQQGRTFHERLVWLAWWSHFKNIVDGSQHVESSYDKVQGGVTFWVTAEIDDKNIEGQDNQASCPKPYFQGVAYSERYTSCFLIQACGIVLLPTPITWNWIRVSSIRQNQQPQTSLKCRFCRSTRNSFTPKNLALITPT